MLYRIIDAGDVPLLIRAFMDSYELVAPVECDQGHIFDTIDDPNDVVLDYSTTIASPKKYFLPPREVLFKFDVAQNDVDAYELDVKPRVLFGVHPCDMNAIEKLDSVFLEGPYPDPDHRAVAERPRCIVGVACTPSQVVLLPSHGRPTGPARRPTGACKILGDRFWVSISSVAAAEVLEESTTLREATDERSRRFCRRHPPPQRGVSSSHIPFVQDVAMLMDTYHSDPFWADTSGFALSELHRVRFGVPHVHVLRYRRRACLRRQDRRACARVGLLHESPVRNRCRRS